MFHRLLQSHARRRMAHLLAIALGATTATPARAGAATIVVPTDVPTIQGAIDAAASGDSIVVLAGTYVESLALAGKDLAISGDPGMTTVTTLDASRILDIGAGVTGATVIDGLTFADGRAAEGGAIGIHDGAAPVLRHCRFESNMAFSGFESRGGAIFVRASTVTIEFSDFFRNSALVNVLTGNFGMGGALYADQGSVVTVNECSFLEDGSGGFEGGLGGAVHLYESMAWFSDCTFTDCFAMSGGGILANRGDLTVVRCRFDRNFAPYGHAAIAWSAYGGLAPSAATGGARSGNTAEGGPLPRLQVDFGVFLRNQSFSSGVVGGFGPGVVQSSTIALNDAPNEASLVLYGGLEGVRNIVASNTGEGVEGEPTTLFECNDVWGNSTNYGPAIGNRTGIDSNISADPLFCDPANDDLELRSDSPCAPPAGGCLQRGALPVGCSVGDAGPVAVTDVRLAPISPNPGRGAVTLAVEVARAEHVRLEVFDAAGRRRATLADGTLEPGRREFRWLAAGARPGIYVAALEAGGRRVTRRFAIVE